MKNLYGSITINKVILNEEQIVEECINYYKLKNVKYGLEIVKQNSTNEEKLEVTNIANITDNEEKIDNVLNMLVAKEIMPSSSDIIEDLLKQYV
jgi:hypothetical protein